MIFYARVLKACKTLMFFSAEVLTVDKQKMFFFRRAIVSLQSLDVFFAR